MIGFGFLGPNFFSLSFNLWEQQYIKDRFSMVVLKVDWWNGWILGLSSVKMERKDRLYWRHPKTKSPDETNRNNIDWMIKAQYASQLTTYFIERKHIQRKGLSPRKHIQMKWLSQLRFLWHLELQVLSSFLHLQAFVLHLDLQVHLNTPCPLFMLWSLAASLTPTSTPVQKNSKGS